MILNSGFLVLSRIQLKAKIEDSCKDKSQLAFVVHRLCEGPLEPAPISLR